MVLPIQPPERRRGAGRRVGAAGSEPGGGIHPSVTRASIPPRLSPSPLKVSSARRLPASVSLSLPSGDTPPSPGCRGAWRGPGGDNPQRGRAPCPDAARGWLGGQGVPRGWGWLWVTLGACPLAQEGRFPPRCFSQVAALLLMSHPKTRES